MATVGFVIYVAFLISKMTIAYQLTTSSSEATAGVSFSFTCEYTTDSEMTLNFMNGLVTYCQISGVMLTGDCIVDKTCPAGNTYSCKSDIRQYTMTIPEISVTDKLHGSNWTCQSPFGIGQPSNFFILHVNIPIKQVTISTIPTTNKSTIEIVAGRRKSVICTTDAGRPSSIIRWYMSGADITSSAVPQMDSCKTDCNGRVVSSSILTYIGNRTDEGKNIYCTAVNVGNQSVRSQNKTVVILYGPNKVIISPSTQNYTIAVSDAVVPINCSADDCKPNCAIVWSGPKIPPNTMSVLLLQKIDRGHAGSYKCTASNIAWNKTSVIVNIAVQYGPYQVNLFPSNQTYTVSETTGSFGPITCVADCKPDCSMTWSGPKLSSSVSSVLNVSRVDRSQAGKYQCTATNIISSNTSITVHVIVQYGPGQVNIFPLTQSYNVTEISQNVGPINCTADCIPNCTMTWSGPGIIDGSTSVLNLQKIARNQAGNYRCTATNIVGSNKSVTLDIIVNYAPNKVNITPLIETYTAIEKTGIVNPITCTADCQPDCTLSWHGPHIPVGTSSILDLQNIDRKQAGGYVCVASNYVGNLTSVMVKVIVHYGPNDVTLSPNTDHYTVNETGSIEPISCTSDCKPNCTMQWSGPNLPDDIESVLLLHSIIKSQTGDYQCTASNNVGNATSFSVTITVNFKPAVNEILGNDTYKENDTVTVLCKVESIPTATIKWRFEDKNLDDKDFVSVQSSYQISTLNIRQVGCLSMGFYNCTANNIIGKDTKGIDIDIFCSPRLNELEYNVSILITVKDQESLNITAPIIAYPKPSIYWTFWKNDSDFNVTHQIANTFIENRAFSNLYIENVTEADFGYYRIYAFNDIGKHEHHIHTFKVVPERKPNPPENVTCIGRLNYVLINWKSSFNGGDAQIFMIYIQENGRADFVNYDQVYIDPGHDSYSEATVDNLKPSTTYHFKVRASNRNNFTMSEPTSCNTTSEVGNNQENTDIVAIGAGTGIGCAIIVLVIVAVYFVFIRRRTNLGQAKELIHRHTKDTDEDEEGLKTNPLYVTSGEVSNTEVGPVYGVVNKKRQKKENIPLDEDNDQGPFYSQVQKSTTHEKKKGKEKKVKKTPRNENYKDIALGAVYENSDKLSKLNTSDELYANDGEPGKDVNLAKGYITKKNKDGLIYADLDLEPGPNGRKFVIRGIENKTNYAMIDLSIKVDPLPSNDDEEDKDSEKSKSAANECNE